MVRIRRLDVRGFRGVQQERSLLFDGKSILLFGENGSGKSSFVDALEKLFTGRVSTLERIQGLSSDRHGPHIRNAGTSPRVQLTFSDAASTAFASDTSPDALPDPIKDYVHCAQENLYILRRRQVLQFIGSQPSERYAQLRPFLPLSGIDDMERALRATRDRAEAIANDARLAFGRLATNLRRDLKLPPSNEPPTEGEAVLAVSRTLEELKQPAICSPEDFEGALQNLDAALAPFGDLSRQSDIASAARVLGELREAVPINAIEELSSALKAMRAKEAEEARVFYEAVLDQGARWIEEEGRNTCPLCEQRITPETTIATARLRLVAMQQLLELRGRARAAHAQAQHVFRAAIEGIERAVKQLAILNSQDRGGSDDLLSRINGTLAEGLAALSVELREVSTEAIDKAREAVGTDAALRQDVAAEEERLQQVLQSLPSPEVAKALVSVRDTIRRVKEAWAELGAARGRMSKAEADLLVASRLQEDAQAARKEEVQRIFDELSEDINTLYTSLHPDENHGGIRLEVRDIGQGSANLRSTFYDRTDEDPRGYYSDAHLDTLGVSIFLALRRWYRRQRPNFDLLVLDDVLTSVDVQHAVRLSELLLREFKDYQLLVTTHDRIWFEHLRDIQARCRVANSFINKIIHKWSIDDGPDISEPEDERTDLERLLAGGSAHEIAAMAGRLFEHLLQEMRYSLRLSVEAKRGEQYEIGDLWPALYKAVRKNYPTLYNAGHQVLEALDVRWPVRNWIGAHWNQWAQNIPRTDAIEFAGAVKELFDVLFCSSCRRFVSPSATPLGQLACRCGKKVYAAPGKQAVLPKTRADLVKETQGAFREAGLDTTLYLAWKSAEARGEH
jgi:energy-coupling factor transporter ATP-binding protein EcfA2